MIWKLEDAKNRFSELVRRARLEGPQVVTKHGRESVVVLAVEQYRTLSEPGSLADFFVDSPFGEALRTGELQLERSEDTGRPIEL